MLKNYLLNRSSDRLARFARGLRDTYFRALSPIDRLGLVITDKGHYPPLLLRREVGDLAAFETSSAEFVAYLKLLCDLKPREHVLDIGCGCGQLALQLEAYLQDGRYTGFDVQSQAVSWCQRRISARSPHFSFFHFNAYNARYNRAGERNIERLPLDDASADRIVMKSVLTHLLEPDFRWYCREIGRLLKQEGSALLSAFVVDFVKAESDFQFSHATGAARYQFERSPETAVGYRLDWLTTVLRESGLKLRSLHQGSWMGTPGLSYQDLMVVERLG